MPAYATINASSVINILQKRKGTNTMAIFDNTLDIQRIPLPIVIFRSASATVLPAGSTHYQQLESRMNGMRPPADRGAS